MQYFKLIVNIILLYLSIGTLQHEDIRVGVKSDYNKFTHLKHEDKEESLKFKKKKDQEFVKDRIHIETLQWAIKLYQFDDIIKQWPVRGNMNIDKHTYNNQCLRLLKNDADLTFAGVINGLRDWYLFSHSLHQQTFSSLNAIFQKHKGDSVTPESTLSVFSVKNNNDVSNGHVNIKSQNIRSDYEKHLSNVHGLNPDKWGAIVGAIESTLDNHPCVKQYHQQFARMRFPRSLLTFSDPAFPQQWHLINRVEAGMDINVKGVWEKGYTGKGVTVAVVDDGIEWDNPDLYPNYNDKGSWDLNSDDANPMPNLKVAKNHHGTRCAGEIAAVANSICGVGVAYDARVAGIRVLDGPMTDVMEAKAFTQGMDVNSIYSCSWGPEDDGKTVDGPDHLASEGLRHGIDYGRNGYGSLYVVASGNGGENQDNCNFDGYANSIFTITIGAVDERGVMPYYAEECASMLAVTFSSGNGFTRNIVTTDWRYHGGTGCTSSHSGTSAAAPLAAGMIALALEANPCLSWRDVQYLCVLTAKKIDVDAAHWSVNKAHLHHSHQHGFGLMDAWALVNAARVWESVPWQTTFTTEKLEPQSAIPVKGESLTVLHTVSASELDGYNIYIIEQVQVLVWLTHVRRGDLSMSLKCPSGTQSVIAAPRKEDRSDAGFSGWTFTTVRCWGEGAEGTYSLTIKDHGKSLVSGGTLEFWRVKVHGTPMTTEEFQSRRKLVTNSLSGKYLNKSFTPPCQPPPEPFHYSPVISDKWLKILALSSVFCLVMAVYESLEYLLCYNDEKAEQSKMTKLWRRAQALANRPSTQRNASTAEYIPLENTEDDICLQEIDTGPVTEADVTDFNTAEYDAYWNSEEIDMDEMSKLLIYRR